MYTLMFSSHLSSAIMNERMKYIHKCNYKI